MCVEFGAVRRSAQTSNNFNVTHNSMWCIVYVYYLQSPGSKLFSVYIVYSNYISAGDLGTRHPLYFAPCARRVALQAQTLPAAALSVPGSGDRVLPSQTGVCVAELETNIPEDFTIMEKVP